MSAAATKESKDTNGRATPLIHQKSHVIQEYGHLVKMPLALKDKARQESVDNLNQLLADTMTIRDMYKKHHWQVSGPTFYQLHLLFDKHYGEQSEIVDTIAERIMTLGGISVAMSYDVAATTTIPKLPKGREEPAVQISRLLQAHEIILQACHTMAKQAADSGDDGTNDMIVGDVMRVNEMQVWFVSQHVVDVPLAVADAGG